ncbi:MAG: hypothetical protein JO368_11920 [Acidimicrobiales bacterium]|nr:hypothetical protein [Acidimicrobiales bacterium]
MAGASEDLEQAVDTYWRAAVQLWCLPLTIFRAVTGSSTLQSTTFTAPQSPAAGTRHQLRLTGDLVPGLPYRQRTEAIPASAVRLQPATLAEGETDFVFLVEGSSVHVLPGATYWSQVSFHDDATGQEVGARVDIWMVVS